MHNNLHHKETFAQLLSSYNPNDECLSVLRKTNLALLIAPVATGRNTIIKELLKLGKYHYLVSDTTRLMRTNDGVPEQNGVEYWFKNEELVLDDVRRGNYLGPAIIHDQQVSGVNVSEIKIALTNSKVAITDMDIQGADEIKMLKPDTINIFLLPPTFDEWMRRLRERGAMDNAEKLRRLKSAVNEIEAVIPKSDVAIFINDDLAEIVDKVNDFILNRNYKEDDNVAREHAKSILSQLKDNPISTLDA
jgi:guanylate kinase